jgi:hypothetical protein
VIEFVDHHPGPGDVLLVPGEVDERREMLNDGAAFIPHGADEDRRPEFAAVLAPVVDLGFSAIVGREFRLDSRHCVSVDAFGQ